MDGMDSRQAPARACTLAIVLATGCGSEREPGAATGTETSGTPTTLASSSGEAEVSDTSATPDTDGSSTAIGSSGVDESDGSSGEPTSTTGDARTCPGADPDRVIECEPSAPLGFDAVVEWTWAGDVDNAEVRVSSTPLVVNLTDDNGDGVVDPCDVPDVVVVVHEDVDWTNPFGEAWTGGHVWILDGATGEPHARIEDRVWWAAQPAAADLDGDGVPEILAVGNLQDDGHLRAWRADGTALPSFTPHNWSWVYRWLQAPSVVDLDGDGAPSIVIGERLHDHEGGWVATLPHSVVIDSEGTQRLGNATVADLDSDGAPEILLGRNAYTWRDDWYWPYYAEAIPSDAPAFSHVGELDGDDGPEIAIMHRDGVSVLDGDGTIVVGPVLPIAEIPGPEWRRPAMLADIDGDGRSEIAMAAGDRLVLMELADGSLTVTAEWTVQDSAHPWPKLAAPTSFDFDGDGVREIVYADAGALLVLDASDPTAEPLVQVSRTSRLELETPVVADVDGDGAAEILLVSNEDGEGNVGAPPLQLIGDASGWVGARRIWNQHAYRVVDVHEDGSIPSAPSDASPMADGFRVNARVEGGQLCD